MIGDPIEAVAFLCGQHVSFGEMIADGEGVDEEATGVASLYAILDEHFAEREFTAATLTALLMGSGNAFSNLSVAETSRLTDQGSLGERIKAALEDASGSPFITRLAPTAQSVAKKLQRIIDRPAECSGRVVRLRRSEDRRAGNRYRLEPIK